MGNLQAEATVQTEPGTPRRRQFGIKHVLLLMCAIAALIVVWQKYVYVHPAHRNPSYEKAQYSRSGAITLGPTNISIKSVSRTDRDGTLLVENGGTRLLNTTVRNAKVLQGAGAWLDSAQIELVAEGGTFDVIDVRVFDFETRQRIDKVIRTSGHRMADRETLQIFRLGEKLPDSVDVFFRVQVYKPGNVPTKLMPNVGATCALPGGTLEITKFVRGFGSYSSATGFVASPEEALRSTGVMLRFNGDNGDSPAGAKYIINTVKKDGTRILRDRYLRFPGSYIDADNRRSELVIIQAGLDEIQHFEMRPFDGQHTFFYEGVQLPKTSTAKFANPPCPTVALNGVEETVSVPEFAPLVVSVQVMKGDAVCGTGGSERQVEVTVRPDGPEDVATKTTIVDRMHGLTTTNAKLIVGPAKSNSSGGAFGAGRSIRYRIVDSPIEDMKTIKFQVPKP